MMPTFRPEDNSTFALLHRVTSAVPLTHSFDHAADVHALEELAMKHLNEAQRLAVRQPGVGLSSSVMTEKFHEQMADWSKQTVQTVGLGTACRGPGGRGCPGLKGHRRRRRAWGRPRAPGEETWDLGGGRIYIYIYSSIYRLVFNTY